jgi:hypothetical protein
MSDLKTVLAHIDAHKDEYVATLDEAIRIKSVSASPEHRPVGVSNLSIHEGL